MNPHEQTLQQFIDENNIDAKIIPFNTLVDHKDNVLEAIKDMNISFDDIIKTIIFVDQDKSLEEGNGVIAIVSATSRVNRSKLKELTNSRIKISGPDEVLKLSTYPAGGVPPIGFKGRIYMDKSLLEKTGIIYAGGGSKNALLKTKISEIIKSSNPIIEDIVEDKE